MLYHSKNKRAEWKKAESLVADWLISRWWTILEKNCTLRWGELDIVADNDEYILCLEVKMVGVIDDIMAYVTDKKMTLVKRTFQRYLRKYPSTKQQRIDVVFVKDNAIRQVCENVTWS